jgi:sporulation protein YlmC with PRC-barrel domain
MNQSNDVAQKGAAQCVAVARSEERHGHKALVAGFFAFLMLITITGLCLLVVARPGFSQSVQLIQVDVAVVAQGHRVSKLIGSSVSNDKNEKVGTLDDVIVDRNRVLFAVLQVGGFLGIGARLVAVPYQSLVIDDAGKKIELPGATREELQKLAEFKHRT